MPWGIAGGIEANPPAGTSEYWTDIIYIYYYVRWKFEKKKKNQSFLFFIFFYFFFGVIAAWVDVVDNIDNLVELPPPAAASWSDLVLGLPALDFFLIKLSILDIDLLAALILAFFSCVDAKFTLVSTCDISLWAAFKFFLNFFWYSSGLNLLLAAI